MLCHLKYEFANTADDRIYCTLAGKGEELLMKTSQLWKLNQNILPVHDWRGQKASNQTHTPSLFLLFRSFYLVLAIQTALKNCTCKKKLNITKRLCSFKKKKSIFFYRKIFLIEISLLHLVYSLVGDREPD